MRYHPGRRCDPGAAPSGVQSARRWGVKFLRPNGVISAWLGGVQHQHSRLILGWKKWPFAKWLWINTYENTIFRGMNTHKSQLFWCEQKGYKVLTHCQIMTFLVGFGDCIWLLWLQWLQPQKRTRGREEYKEACGWWLLGGWFDLRSRSHLAVTTDTLCDHYVHSSWPSTRRRTMFSTSGQIPHITSARMSQCRTSPNYTLNLRFDGLSDLHGSPKFCQKPLAQLL